MRTTKEQRAAQRANRDYGAGTSFVLHLIDDIDELRAVLQDTAWWLERATMLRDDRARVLNVERIRKLVGTRTDHSEHGRGNADDGPDDPDCPCRDTPQQTECAGTGCGFCEDAR